MKNDITRKEIALTQTTNDANMAVSTSGRNLEKVKLELKELKKELERSIITAPVTGAIQSVGDINVGDYVKAGKTVFTMSDSAKLHICYLGDDYSLFRLGMAVNVLIDNIDCQGKVVATPKEAPVNEYEKLKDSVFIEVKNPPKNMAVGDPVNLHAVLYKKVNIIVLPSNVVKDFQGRRFVKLLENGISVERNVEVGIETDTECEITKGLKVGEKVIED
jgi:multidrug efflux pump subunit AcrA (membrane-fusion protein)